ncbi:MAG TPA: hypothetical protein VM657_07945, partial [Sphingomonas sp.]|nr:hypothetical protein [Sphingomonas sp.]
MERLQIAYSRASIGSAGVQAKCPDGLGHGTGQSVIAHGAAGAYVVGTGRAADRQAALDFGANEFVDLDNDALEDVGVVDLVFDVIGGDIQKRSAALVRP